MIKELFENGEIFTIPNAFSVLRVFISPVVLYYMSIPDSEYLILILTIAIIFTDYLDGYMARKLNQISESGKILDPFADKVTAILLMWGLVLYRDFPLWAFLFILGRDILIVVAAAVVMKGKKIIPMSNNSGKLTVNFLVLMFIFYLFEISPWDVYLLYVTLTLMIISVVLYFKSNYLDLLSK